MQKKLVYDVIDVQKILGLGKNQTYALIQKGEFPVKKVGAKYLIPKQPFLSWLNSAV